MSAPAMAVGLRRSRRQARRASRLTPWTSASTAEAGVERASRSAGGSDEAHEALTLGSMTP